MLNGKTYIFGGRGAPNKPHIIFSKIDEDGNLENIPEDNTFPTPRWSHSLTNVNGKLYLTGGRSQNETFGDIFEFDTGIWGKKQCLKSPIFSHSSCEWKGKLIITGGLKNFSKCEVNDDLIEFDPKMPTVQYISLPNYYPRFSHTSHVKGNVLVQVGGVVIAPTDIVVTKIDLATKLVTNYESTVSLEAPLVQHSSFIDEEDEKIVIFGGGTNCFSFGMHVNKTVIKIPV